MGLWQDVQFALRLLVKDKWFTLVAAVALGLGIGVNATVFTFVNAVLIRGLPFHDPDQIVAVNSLDPVRNRPMGVSFLDFTDWSAATTTFTGMAAYTGSAMNVSDEGRAPDRYSGSMLSANAFRLLGQPPLLGRDFLPEDDRPGAASVVLLGYGVWQNRYGSDPTIVGKSVRVNDVPSVVIGVMPEGFKFPQNADMWQPIANIRGLEKQLRNARNMEAFGRLAPGVSMEQGQAELIAIAKRLTEDYPDTNKDIQPKVQTFNQRFNGGTIRSLFLSLMGAVGFVLLIACANVANLLLARSAVRAREISVRASIGASHWRIVRQLLVESVLLAAIGGVLGLGLAMVGTRVFDWATRDAGIPYWIAFTMDGTVLAYFAAICLGTSIIFGLAPALHVAKTDVNDVLKEGGRSGSAGARARRWSGVLVTAELALTLALLAGAGFMVRNILTIYRLDLGIETSHLLTMALTLPEQKYPAIEERLAFYQRLEERLRANPRFRSVSVASHGPMQGGFGRRLAVDGRPLAPGEQAPIVTVLTVDPHYFDTIGVTLVRGRAFTAADGAPGQVTAIVNTRFAQMYFPNEDPIGRRIVLSQNLGGGPPPAGGMPTALTGTIVGLAPNVRQAGFNTTDPDPVAYMPQRADPRGFMTLLARADGDPNAMTPLLREELRAIDPDLPLYGIQTLEQSLARQRWPFQIFATLFSTFAGIALTLSAVGLYAVTAYSVSQRAQEIGVRMALGAQSTQVTWMFLRRAFVQLGIGLTIGLAGAFGVGTIFESADLLVQTSGHDPATIASIALVLAVVSLVAAVVPARRATTLDPLAVLRRD